MATGSESSIDGIDQVAATITAALVAKSPKADELSAVNLFFKIRALLIEQDKLEPRLGQAKVPVPRR
jgi:hypothetical protein